MNTTRAAVVAGFLAAATAAGQTIESVGLKGHTKAVNAVAWAADGKTLATAGDDRTIRVWDPASGRQTALLSGIAREGYGEPVVAFTADLKVVAVNYWGEITIRALADGKTLATIDPVATERGKQSAFRPDVYAMSFSPDGKRLATAGARAGVGGPHGLPGGLVTIWDVESGKAVHRFDTLSTGGSSVVWSPDGKRLVAGTSGAGGELQEAGEVWVWEAESGKAIHTFPVKPKTEYGEWASAADVAVSRDGKRVAAPVTAGSRGTPAGLIIPDAAASVRVWDLGTGKATLPLKGLTAAVNRVAFSPDGKFLATAGSDKVLRLWVTDAGKELAALPAPDRVGAVAFSPDGKSLAAGCRDGSVRVWAVPAER